MRLDKKGFQGCGPNLDSFKGGKGVLITISIIQLEKTSSLPLATRKNCSELYCCCSVSFVIVFERCSSIWSKRCVA